LDEPPLAITFVLAINQNLEKTNEETIMIDYFYMGGPLFMSLISIAGLASVAVAVLAIFK